MGAFVSALKKIDFELKEFRDLKKKYLKLFCLFTNIKIIF